MSSDFITNVRAAGASDNFTSIVKVSNADEIGNAIEVANEAARPTPSLALQGLTYFAKAENTYWTINDAGNGWTSGFGGAGSGDMAKATYDPNTVSGDAFDMDNMVEGATTKILTDSERTKLTGIETAATADQTGAEIKTAYELEADTNAFTDAEQTKLTGIEASATADQTAPEIETAYNAQVAAMSQATAEAGTSTTVERVTAQRISQAIAKLTPVAIIVSASDTTTDLTAGTAKVTFRMPFAMTLTAVRASVSTAPTGSVLTVDINETGTSVLSTKLTIDATEKTSTTAATAPVISDSTLADDAEITIDIDGVGSTVAGKELVIYLIGTPA